MNSLPRWNDDRLDELSRKLERVEPVIVEVAVMKADMKNLTTAVEKNTVATEKVAYQLEQTHQEPLTRWRNFRSSLVVVLAGALVGGGLALVGTLLSHH